MAEIETGAAKRLRSVDHANAVPLTRFLQTIDGQSGLSKKDRLRLLDQAILLLEMNYVHLPLKRAMHAINPIRRLKLLRFRLDEQKESEMESERQFHKRMLEIFASLRDLHTHYQLPSAFQNQMAFLPFLIEQYFVPDGKNQWIEKFMVSRIARKFVRSGNNAAPEVASFKPGVEVLAWNGVPIRRAIEINGESQAGSNPEARFARGLDSLTTRPLDLSLPPDESWVSITYRSKEGKILTLDKQKWMVDAVRERPIATKTTRRKRAAIDLKKTKINQIKKQLYQRQKFVSGPRDIPVRKEFADLFYAQVKSIAGREIGYVRLFSFDPEDPDQFVAEFKRVITSKGFPQQGLILDVRGNPGGKIRAGERLLQLFTPRRVMPELFEFINTPLNLEICRHAPQDWELTRWAQSMAEAVQTGAIYSSGFPFSSEESCNDIGQVYHGPVILIIDALSYSTTDMFAAGFQDNEVGEVLGTSDNTGAGGANNWTYDDLMTALRKYPGSPFKPLPKGADIGLAMRRSIRVGRNSGRPLEELGIVPDDRHYITKRDLLEENYDLLRKAAEKLRNKPIYSLSVRPFREKDETWGLILSCTSKLPLRQPTKKNGSKTPPAKTLENISYLDIFLNGRFKTTINTNNGSLKSMRVTLGRDERNGELLVQAFDEAHNLVAASRLHNDDL
jgi:C-terminal processing protease CtpA/Prc